MNRHLPDCMMPDGAEPCKGYSELREENDKLRTQLEAIQIKAAQHFNDLADHPRQLKYFSITKMIALRDEIFGERPPLVEWKTT